MYGGNAISKEGARRLRGVGARRLAPSMMKEADRRAWLILDGPPCARPSRKQRRAMTAAAALDDEDPAGAPVHCAPAARLPTGRRVPDSRDPDSRCPDS